MLAEEAIAIIEIQQLLYRYCRGVDRGEMATLKGVYHPGAIDNHGAFKGTGEAFAERLVPMMDASNVAGQHHITNMLIQVEGDKATGESYYIAYHPDKIPGTDKFGLALACGRYLDKFEKRNGEWKIADRRVLMDFSVAPSEHPPWPNQANYSGGGRREEDASWGFLPKPL